MRRLMTLVLVLAVAAGVPAGALASPENDLKEFREHFADRFPEVAFNDFGNGVYSIDEPSRAEWEEIKAFPPYEIAVEEGKAMFNTPFANGRAYADCFANDGIGICQNYPYFDRHFYAKRGQLNLACANCHVDSAGMMIRADKLSPALGHVTHFPVYRSKWGNMGTLHRRYGGCSKRVRAKPFKHQSDEYRALEYFQAYMSNGIEVNGPGARK